jgi:hypothetical protein|tara:strand:+ start:10810 stop:11334 length:525 start_codon:yes stop_codon:yes gene_type:complete
MKTTKRVFAGLLTIALALSSVDAAQQRDVTVSIDFRNPSGFSDIEIDGFSGDKEQSIIFDLLRGEFKENAGTCLPDGYTLNVEIQDIDLAGYHEPLYPRFDGVRIMKSIYPPRLNFSYAILDDDQLIVEEGNSSLSNVSYLHGFSLSSRRNDTAYYVRSLIKDWGRQDLGYKLK